jgi:hypothetical protein
MEYRYSIMQASSMLRLLPLCLILQLSIFILSVPEAAAGTVWAAAGSAAAVGTLVAKNHDGNNREHDELRLLTPEEGFTCLVLFSFAGEDLRNFVSGINEKGMVLIRTDVETKARKQGAVKGDILDLRILTSFDSVDAVLRDRRLFSGSCPVIYLVADRTRVALTEIAAGGHFAVRESKDGFLYHTDHYREAGFQRTMRHISKSSVARLEKIGRLLEEAQGPCTMDDFITMSANTEGTPSGRIWRAGDSKGKSRTLSTWIVSLPKTAPPEVSIHFTDPENPKNRFVINMLLDEPFWTEGIK